MAQTRFLGIHGVGKWFLAHGWVRMVFGTTRVFETLGCAINLKWFLRHRSAGGGALMLAFWYWHGGPNFPGNGLKVGRGVGCFWGRGGVVWVGIPIGTFVGCRLTGGPNYRASGQHIFRWAST